MIQRKLDSIRVTREPSPLEALADLAPPAWVAEALCGEVGGDLWFPDKDGSGDSGQSHASGAKATCLACPVRVECLQHAIETNEPHGIWGGLTPNERRSFKKGQPLKVCALDDCNRPVGRATSAKYCSTVCASRARSRRLDERKAS